jgi:PhzF family phenazine biosynthesis protein
MAIPVFHVDAFADRAFAGNPAAVCLLEEPRDERWMQQVAQELNLSETAFVICGARLRTGADANPEVRAATAPIFPLRWFTPLVEVDLCGHATLATAHVLWETGRLAGDAAARFLTRSGELTAGRRDGWVELDLPATACAPATLSPAHLAALGIAAPRFVGQAGPRHVIEVESETLVRELKPDFHALRPLPGRGIAVTARSDGRPYDFVSRYFAPWVGVNEDPVTGSVHCALATYWAARLGKQEMLACQASPRGGEIRVRLDGDRVRLGGKAVTVAAGTLLGGA